MWMFMMADERTTQRKLVREKQRKAPKTQINHAGLGFKGIILYRYIQVDLASWLPAEKFPNLEQIFSFKTGSVTECTW